MAFKVGDKVTGKGKGNGFPYSTTTSDATMIVRKVLEDNIVVEIVENINYTKLIGERFRVDPSFFKLIKPELTNK